MKRRNCKGAHHLLQSWFASTKEISDLSSSNFGCCLLVICHSLVEWDKKGHIGRERPWRKGKDSVMIWGHLQVAPPVKWLCNFVDLCI